MSPDPPGLATISPLAASPGTTLPPVFTHAQARALGVSDRALYAWRDAGEVDLVARGIYCRTDVVADLDLIEVAVRAPDATLCLTSALARHGLVDEIPATIDLALPRSRRAPRTAAPVSWHRFDASTISLGRSEVEVTPGLTIGVYGPARSIVDAFRLRHLFGQEQAVEALKRWIRQPGNDPASLLAIALRFPAAEPPLRRTLQILL